MYNKETQLGFRDVLRNFSKKKLLKNYCSKISKPTYGTHVYLEASSYKLLPIALNSSLTLKDIKFACSIFGRDTQEALWP